jgi:hypothetical protein
MTQIQGVYAAAITPRRLGMQDINLAATWDLFDFLVEHGVNGIVLLGVCIDPTRAAQKKRDRKSFCRNLST